MWIPLIIAVVTGCAGLLAWAAWRAATDRPVILRQLIAGGVVEAAIVVQLVVAGVSSATGSGPADVPTFWGYAVTTLVLLPVAALWAFAERTRWSSVVLAVAAFTVAFLEFRMVQVWAG